MAIFFIVMDGLGDLPNKQLNQKTPLEYANTINMDKLAARGSLGTIYTVGKGIAPESDVAVCSLLGYDANYFTGRGPLEALGAGIKIEKGDLALRVNFATVEKNKIIDRRCGRTLTTEQAKALSSEIEKNVNIGYPFTFKSTVGHRAVLIIKGGFSDNISNTDPGYQRKEKYGIVSQQNDLEVKKCVPLDNEEESLLTANLINNFIEKTKDVLEKSRINKEREKQGLLKANFVTLRDAGNSLPDFKKLGLTYHKKFGAIVSMPLEKGIARISGMDVLDFDYPELKNQDIYSFFMEAMLKNIEAVKKHIKKTDYDFYYIHIKETDLAGHDGLPVKKVKFIEKIDKELFGWLLNNTNKDDLIVATADHSTPCSKKAHSADPVPLLISGKQVKADNQKTFSEKTAKKGSIGEIIGKELMPMIMKL